MTLGKLEDLCTINPDTLGSGTPADYRFRYIDISAVAKGTINWEVVREVEFGEAPSRARRILKSGDVIFSTVRPGLQAHGRIQGHQADLVCSTGFAVLRPNHSADSSFLFHQILSDSIAAQVRAFETGSNYPAVNESDLRNIRFVTLAPSDRSRIAAVLDTVDALIESSEAVLAKLRQVRAGLLHDLLTRGLNADGQLRDPDAHPEQFQDSPLGRIPREWEVTTLGDALDMRSGNSLTGEKIYNADEFPVFGGNGFRGYTDSYTHDGDFVLIGRQGALCGNVARATGRFFATEHAVVCTPISPISAGWLFCQLDRMNLNRFSESSAQPGLSVKKIGRLQMPLPPLEEQIRAESKLAFIDSEITAEESEHAKLRHLKSGLMTDLLEGRVRVPEDLACEPARTSTAKRVDLQPE